MTRNTDPLYAEVKGNDAEYCRRKGWGVGTLLSGDEGYGPDVIRLTAIGERRLLAVRVARFGRTVEPFFADLEQDWTLGMREWTEVSS